jgi:DNA-binding GntR family transcriptional regulator
VASVVRGTPFRRRPQLADEVVQYVRALVMFGDVDQGSFLRLDRLAKELGISVTPVREAMAALEREGLVRLEPRRGYVVTRLSRQDVEDLYMVEAFIQGELAARAAKEVTSDRLAELRQEFDEMRRFYAIDEFDQADERFFRFYSLLHETAESPRLSWLAGMILPYPVHGYAADPVLRAAILDGLTSVLHALSTRDPDHARRAMEVSARRMATCRIDRLEELGLWDRPSEEVGELD